MLPHHASAPHVPSHFNSNPIIGLMLTNPVLRDQVSSFLRTGGFRVVSLDDPHCSTRVLNQFGMLIVSNDVGHLYQANLMKLKDRGRPFPILVVCGSSSLEALSWVEAGFDDAMPFTMGQSHVCMTVDAYLQNGVCVE